MDTEVAFNGVQLWTHQSQLPKRVYDNGTNATPQIVSTILEDVRQRGLSAVIENGIKFKELSEFQNDSDLFLIRKELQVAFESLSEKDRGCLIRVRDRIHRFAKAQLNALQPLSLQVSGCTVGHDIVPVKRAGCYAPGGRYPLPSSVLMTTVTARAAGVEHVILASPKPSIITKAAAYIGGADGLLTVGGPAAIGAMAYGVTPLFVACDVVVGPGNRYVTEAKKQINGDVRIDLLAGPSEVFIMADDSASPRVIACDMIAQAEHDVEASSILITNSEQLAIEVNKELIEQIVKLPLLNRSVASKSLNRNSGILLVGDLLVDGVKAVNDNAPEHLEIMTRHPDDIRKGIENVGGLFEGFAAAEVFGDYGIGPNHTLPTLKGAKYRGGLSVYDFLKIQTWIKAEKNVIGDIDYQEMVEDTIQMARFEGLHGHALSAECRLNTDKTRFSNKDELSGILRHDVDHLMKYHPSRSVSLIAKEIGYSVDSIVKLDANENSYGAPKGIANMISERLQNEASIYPDPDQIELRQRLVKLTGRHIEEIVCGAGGDDLIQLLIQICRPTGIVVTTPTFPLYDFFARINRSQVHSVPLSSFPNFQINVNQVISTAISTDSSIVLLARPNNPTGSVVSHEQISQLCETLKGKALIVIDEAYIEFSDQPNCIPLLDSNKNLCIIRTFSKCSGLAGLRCGYCLAHPTLIKRLLQIKIPYNLNIAASLAASYALDHQEQIRDVVQSLKSERLHLEIMFKSSSIFPHIKTAPSDGNFVLLKIDSSFGETAAECYARLWKSGILTRRYHVPELQDCIRISYGTPHDTRRLMLALSVERHLFNETRIPAAILFDMDGVLADVSGSYDTVIVDTCRHFGAEVVNKLDIELLKKEGFNNDWILTHELIRRKIGTLIPFDDVRDHFNLLYRKRSCVEKLIIPIDQLDLLKEITPLGIVTGRPRRDAEEFIDRFNMRSIFKVVVCMEDTEKHKPDPEPLILAMQKLKSMIPQRPSHDNRVLYIGNTGDDIRAAIEASRAQERETGTEFVPIGVVPPQNANKSSIEYAANLYEAGAVMVGLRWDCITALGISIPSSHTSQKYETLSTTEGTTTGGSTTEESFNQNEPKKLLGERVGKSSRKTKETEITCKINLDGVGRVESDCGIGFLDHMIHQLGKHGLFDIELKCYGDLNIDDHHTVEDCAIVLGQAIDYALGDRRGIKRFGSAFAPLDESLSRAVIDLAGRGWGEIVIPLEREKIGELSSEMVHHFLISLSTSMRAAVHIDVLRGFNAHHKVESCFKALALALKMATDRKSVV